MAAMSHNAVAVHTKKPYVMYVDEGEEAWI